MPHPVIICPKTIGMGAMSRLPLLAHPYKINESACQEENDYIQMKMPSLNLKNPNRDGFERKIAPFLAGWTVGGASRRRKKAT
jgi:hypothetical protein